MRKLILFALIASLGLALCGCQETGEVENQAYVLVLALDRSDDGGLALTARVPRIGKGDGKGDATEAENSSYLTFSVSGPTWSKALDALQWATPRRINLSHIELIVASEALASQSSFPALMNALMDTPHLYANARFAVCCGSARAFLEAGETVIGTRLTSEIHAMLSQYAAQGFIPETSLADACYCANGIYGDPVAIWGEVADEAHETDRAAEVAETPMRQRYSGTALFRDGRFVYALSTRETRLLNLVCGRSKTLDYAWQDALVELTPEAQPRLDVRLGGEAPTLVVSLRLCAPEGMSDTEAAKLTLSIEGDVTRLVKTCQQLGCDPFGFAEAAARGFPTVGKWLDYGWRDHYRQAALDFDLSVSTRYSS